MKLSFSTLGCPDWSLEQIAANARAFGYDGVELRTQTDGKHFSPDASIAEATRVGKMFRDQGVPVISIKGYCSFAFVDDRQVEANQLLMRKLLPIAEAMGAKFVRTFAGQIPPGSDQATMTEKVGRALKPLAKEAAQRNVRIGLEIHDDWCAGKRVMELVRIIDNRQGFGIVYDIFNAFHSGMETWDTTYAQVKDHICYCHVKDGYQGSDGKLRYVMLGAGDLPVREIVQAFKKDGYDSYFSLEWEKMWHPELEPPERVFPHYPHKIKALWNA